MVVRRKDYASSEEFDAALLKTLKEHDIDIVVLAGFLSVLGPSVIEAYPRRILNIHPDRKSTRLNSSHSDRSRMPSSA